MLTPSLNKVLHKFANDIVLIQALKKGDSDAYTFLVNSFHQKLCIYAYNLTNNYDLTEDIVQNVFISFWKNKHRLKDDFVIKSYLYRSVYNEFINQYRKQKPISPLEQEHIEGLNAIVENEDGESLEILIKLVKQEIENLPPKCKQTFILSKQEGLSNIEIAEYMNISLKSVEAHITQAFKLIRKKVGEKAHCILFLLFGTPKNVLTF
ncbi:RNA polymerase sigma factor [Flavivirga jejuensis]|uniref:Sigma-70 family RNA polymerase sigma factor n=1 Tax=Flavivirga jejuensis TaxID=870487 RepID=A0ABT8WK31_9FLAO|nr:sigma-70 family RNA polymerase sigma factor [Flavivirga jejuensis]MDO5973513.1 sigma-70 family RNA polymerase sigma factor [Flavivirga jejuensis]